MFRIFTFYIGSFLLLMTVICQSWVSCDQYSIGNRELIKIWLTCFLIFKNFHPHFLVQTVYLPPKFQDITSSLIQRMFFLPKSFFLHEIQNPGDVQFSFILYGLYAAKRKCAMQLVSNQ
ncbi:MAG: hypothetical protein RLZZ28_363 [Bacteroidota bacterium]